MAAIVASGDVQEIVSKLSSDKAKAREEGIKLLNTWLEGERSIAFCKYLGQKTAKLKPNEICHSETWPFLVRLLTQCASMEISPNKRRPPKLVFAKTLRIVVQRAHDSKFSGKNLPLLCAIKPLFTHIWEVLGNVPSFQSEYGVILRHLLAFKDYRFHMRMRIYSGLVRLYMEKVESSLIEKNDNQYNPKEEVFRWILTLQSLIENPPGDFPNNLREDIVRGFVGIFSHIRDEDKLSRKLMDCINKYLLKDGPNLGCNLMEIHGAVQKFVFSCWLTTHDRPLKDSLILYARLQLNLTSSPDGSVLVEQILDVVCKELDQSFVSGGSVPRGDTTKDDKFGVLNASQYGLVELAAAVIYRACVSMTKPPPTEKRAKRENIATRLKESLMKGKWLWHAAFCCLTRSYHTRIRKALFIYWFEGISTSFERIMNDANMGHAYDGLLWTLRSLQELSCVLLPPESEVATSPRSSALNEYNSSSRKLWSCLMHGLPIFSNVAAVVDAAFILLGYMLSSARDTINTLVVPQDVWDLRLFKQMPSVSVLYFISCYFSARGSQGDLRDILHLRKSLLKAVLGHLNWQESSMLNEQMALLLPAAVYSLSAGCAPFKQCHGRVPLSYGSQDLNLPMSDWIKAEELEQDYLHELFECSIEVLANLDLNSAVKGSFSSSHSSARLPRQLRDPLLIEMETIVLGALSDDIEARPLTDLISMCAVLSNFICGSYFVRQEGASSFPLKMTQYLLKLLDHAADIIEENQNDLSSGCFSSDIIVGNDALVTSFRSFVSSPLFVGRREQNSSNFALCDTVMQSMERLLNALVKGYHENCENLTSLQSGKVAQDLAPSAAPLFDDCPLNDNKSRITDMELDVADDSGELDSLAGGAKISSDVFFSVEKWKLGMVSVISGFFSVLHAGTWDVLFQILQKERDSKVHGAILYKLCQHPYWSSSSNIIDMISFMDDMVDAMSSLKLDCIGTLSNICAFLGTLISMEDVESDKVISLSLKDIEDQQSLTHLGDLVHKIAELDHLEWSGRVKLIDCICDFVLISPSIGQTMIGRLLLLLRDSDYRVRLSVARRIGVLFQTWDGHGDLFLDICSNFGITLVVSTKEKLVTASQALSAGPHPRPNMETIIITLMYLAFHSEKIEVQAVFMMCVISAIDPSERELVFAALDSLSRKLQYTNRFKYLEELIGSILFCWVACGVSLPALVEIRQLFVSESEPSYFVQYCSNWLLPSLVLNGDRSNLSWVAKIAGQPLSSLVKDHFVQIFSICIGLHCSKTSEGEMAGNVLQNSFLQLAKISESERDTLIKKHMVSIVSKILSLASCLSETVVPLFSQDTVERAIQTVVDGFLELEDYPTIVGVVDKINIFRPDRVFMFILELHYKIAAAVHHRHKCHRLAGIEVLVNILGHRVAVASTSNYLLNLSGQFISFDALQDQCCRIISTLLRTFKSNPSDEMTNVFGEQLQFLVSKLVACYAPSKANEEQSGTELPQILSLLIQLIVDSDPSLHGYITELEPFPETNVFDEVRRFYQEVCLNYSPKEHLLKLMSRSPYVPPRLLLSSIQALHTKLLSEESFQSKTNEDLMEGGGWSNDSEIVNAVWALVRICSSNDGNNAGALVSDFISMIGIGDPYSVVFHLPGSYGEACKPVHISVPEVGSHLDPGLSDDLLVALLRLLKKYLMDDSVKIVDMASQSLRGILSTERGQRSLQSLDSYERALVEVHSKGTNLELVEKFLSDLERKFNAEAISLDDSTLWVTHGKSFETWICPLTYVLCGYCNDVILRLCQEIVFLKSEVAELLLPSIFVNLAGRREDDIDLQRLISLQVQNHIFAESNKLVKSVQVLLSALNELRLRYVVERSSPSKHDNSKPTSHGSKSRSTPGKAKDSAATSKSMLKSTSLWNKVYWLSIDYLVVATSAVICGSVFTAVMYVEHWCEEHFKNLTLGSPDFSDIDSLPRHIEILVSAVTHINEPDSLYGIVQSHKLTSQVITYEHEGNWGKALESYDLQVRSAALVPMDYGSKNSLLEPTPPTDNSTISAQQARLRRPYKGLIRSLQQIGCMHVLDFYCQGLTSRMDRFEHDQEFTELQYEAAWRVGNWDFSMLYVGDNSPSLSTQGCHFNENLHSCLRTLHEGDLNEFHIQLRQSKQELVSSVSRASEESTGLIYSSIIKLQILYHLGIAWDLRWRTSPCEGIKFKFHSNKQKVISGPIIPTLDQLSWLDSDWNSILKRAHLHMDLIEPFIAFRRVLLQILGFKDSTMQHLLQSASTLRKGSRSSQAAAFLHEHKLLVESEKQGSTSYWLGRLEEAKLLRSQGQNEMAISLAKYISENYRSNKESSDVYRLVGKWLAETRSSNSRTILEKYLKPAVSLAENEKTDKKLIERQGQSHFHLAHYADALFRSHEERLTSSEWQAATRLRKHKTVELEALIKRLKSSKGDKTDYSIKIQELQKQLSMDKEEAEKLQDDRDNFLSLALEGYKRCLVVGDKYDVKVMFRLVSLWFSLSHRSDIVNSMLTTSNEVQSYKFIPLVYQIASRMGGTKDSSGPQSFQFALVSLLKKMAVDHPYHTIFQLLALANGDRIKDKQRSRNSFVVDMDKKLAAENLLQELLAHHGRIIRQMKQMVEIYIRLAELDTRREDTNKRIALPRDIRNLRLLELVPVVTASFPVDRNCQYNEGSFPHFKGLGDSVLVMNGINAPKVVECMGSDGRIYKQLAKSGNDDLRQDAVMEQCFGLVNTFLQNHRDTWKRRLGVRTYKVVPFTPSAGVLEWVNGTLPLGEYLIGSSRNGGAHGRYGIGDWPFLKCREQMTNAKDKRRAFKEVCEKFRPVMHHFFLERFLQPAEWFEKRLAYTRSVAASSMVGYIVGLGDRHAMNILIDQATAEVVHIDLGVAFEQGLMLKTPERVPFRLTRDIIDGMGVTGVEGVFRRCCEETLSVMRTNKEALLTIVEVFIHDPLYKWALSPLKALQRQKEMDDELEMSLEGSQDDYEGNKDAARALMRVKQKLDGYEEGEMRSVNGQVQQLIQDAIDTERLCQMFPGWGSWL